ncbi:MAG: hypothetical protein F2817_20735 [Actinobacteria bacterium]|nr:hypothetical protein [Actinomycetota bacterium]
MEPPRRTGLLRGARKASVDDAKNARGRKASTVGATGKSLLKTSGIKDYREKQLRTQQYICPLCARIIALSDSALDHCHKTGKIRKVLHRWCNAVLGRVENWSGRSGIDKIQFLKAVVHYLEAPQTTVEHPSHGKKRKRRRRK